jgi:hypothetical protein
VGFFTSVLRNIVTSGNALQPARMHDMIAITGRFGALPAFIIAHRAATKELHEHDDP